MAMWKAKSSPLHHGGAAVRHATQDNWDILEREGKRKITRGLNQICLGEAQ